MKFDYKKFGDTIRPVIPVRVMHGDRSFRYEVLIDSGADSCFFHTELAEALGIIVKSGKKRILTGVGGKSSEYFMHPVSIEVGGWQYKIDAGFLPTIGGRSAPYGIVGQRGFFEFFKVLFDYKKGDIELKIKT